MGILYVIATPIGNMEDITLRALRTLKEVDFIACEDTRQSMKLLSKYEIRNHLFSCNSFNEERSADGIIKLLKEGKNGAYISDSGTPCISDPGSRLVNAVRKKGFSVIPIPGPSAFSAVASIAGMPGKTLIFEGFLPLKEGKKKKRLKELLNLNENFVLYESPKRVIKLLKYLEEISKESVIIVAREMTKVFEEYIIGTASEAVKKLEEKNEVKGEFTIFISKNKLLNNKNGLDDINIEQ